jgi:cytochrome b subunit of formate dehydrogenase
VVLVVRREVRRIRFEIYDKFRQRIFHWLPFIPLIAFSGSSISMGGFINVTSGLMGPMKKGDMTRCLSNW